MPALVSVIIPCKDGAAWLGDAIKSCLDQTWGNLEIIVVDNGSADETSRIAKAYRVPAVTVLECDRAGASAARNVGLAHAHGDFIQFLDADDVLDRDKIRVQMERLATGPDSSIVSGAWTRFRHNPAEGVFVADAVWADLGPDAFLISSWLGGGMMPSFAWLTPRHVIKKAGLWNEQLSLNDDGEFFCRVVLASSGVLFCNDARGYYRTGAGLGLSRRRDRSALASAYQAIELSCSALLWHCNTASAREACATQFQRFIFDAYPDVPDLVQAAERRVAELGGSELQMQGASAFQILASSFGWKVAKRCQLAWRRFRSPATVGPH